MQLNFLNKLKIYFHLNRFDIRPFGYEILVSSDVLISAFTGGMSEVKDELTFKKDGISYTLKGSTLYLHGTDYIYKTGIETFDNFKMAIRDLDFEYSKFSKLSLSKPFTLEKIKSKIMKKHFTDKYSLNHTIIALSKFRNELERLYYLDLIDISNRIDSYTIDKNFKLRYDVGDMELMKEKYNHYIKHFGYYAIYRYDVNDFKSNPNLFIDDLNIVIDNLNHDYPDFKHYYNLLVDEKKSTSEPIEIEGRLFTLQKNNISRICIYADLVEHKSIIHKIDNNKSCALDESFKLDLQ